jgi:DtxR family transcriptional regulator, Mn-dependent transcriptional regulator
MSPTAAQKPLTGALEDYLETIYQLVSDHGFARVRDIAKARKVRAGSVTPALKRLAKMGLVDYQRREYVNLTEEGARQARRVYARHELLTRFFGEVLQMAPVAAERDACAMEHHLSDEAMDRMVRFFEYLGTCRNADAGLLDRFHGCSLVHEELDQCDNDCQVGHARLRSAEPPSRSLFDLRPGQRGTVARVNAHGAIRQRLLDMGILPRAEVTVARLAPTGDPIWIRIHGTELALRRQEAEAVLLEDA